MDYKVLIIGAALLTSCGSVETKEDSKNLEQERHHVYSSAFTDAYKVSVDSVDYIIVRSSSGGVAIIKHGFKKK